MFCKVNVSRNNFSRVNNKVNDKVTFTKHISNKCNMASNHLKALAKIRKFLFK